MLLGTDCYVPEFIQFIDHVPNCFYGPDYVGYEVNNIQNYALKTVVTLNRKISSGFPKDSQIVILEIISLNDYSVQIKFYDPNQRRYEVPIPVLDMNSQKTVDKPLYKVNVNQNGSLEVFRTKTSKPIFKTDLKKLIFSDQYLQVMSDLPSDYLYGLGEHKDVFRKSAKQWKRYTIFNRDYPPKENFNIYSSHPFYLSVEDSDGNSNGVFIFNENAMDVILQPKPAITWRTIGGILDFYVFLGPQPNDVIKQYTRLIGFPHLPPYWAFGYQLCKYNYPNGLEGAIAAFNRTRKAGIPYDVQWTDMDAMDIKKDFSYNHTTFAKLPQFVSDLHKAGMKYVPMIDPGISNTQTPGTYFPYDLGIQMDIFIKNSSGQPIVGTVWPGNTVWPDFTDPKATVYWTKIFSDFHKVIEFDGSWLDMNEPSNYLADGSIYGCPNNSLEKPQYVPGTDGYNLWKTTLCMTSRQKAGLHYDVHNLYGITNAIATNIALRTVLKKRPFIISRSSAPGHGKYAGHWDGDTESTWDYMRWTIPSILNFNLFGIPLVGADICGFNNDTTVELCARWSELGAFYPFSRNHNSAREQDPAFLGPVVTEAAKIALQWKYSLLPYLYTLFFKAHTTGDTVVRPLFFEFPRDNKSYETSETQFMWGSALMIVPTLEEKATSVNAYLPPGLWYDWKTHSPYLSKGETYKLDSPLTEIKLFIRSGHVLVIQEPKVTTEETRKGNFELLIVLDSDGSAEGSLFWDSGDGLDNLLLVEFDLIEFSVKNNSLTSVPIISGYDISNQHLNKAVVLGVKSQPKTVVVNGISTKNFIFNSAKNQLVIDNIGANLLTKNIIQWS